MRWPLNDPGFWTLIFAIAIVAGAIWVFDHGLDLEPQLDPAFDPLAPPPLETMATPAWVSPAQVRALEAQRTVAATWDVNPLAGSPLEAATLAGHTAVLPVALDAVIDGGIEAAVGHALARARQAVRDPEERIGPGDLDDLRARVARGLLDELSLRTAALASAAPLHHRPRVLVQGTGPAGIAWHLGNRSTGEVEQAIYAAWIELLEAWYREQCVPVDRFALRTPHGAWQTSADGLSAALGITEQFQPGWADLEGWLGRRDAAGYDPFDDLGRLAAVNLLARAGLVEVVFAGHGREVRDPPADEARFGAYRLGALAWGDECQELVILRRHRGALSVRYGFCLGRADPLVALSCSNAVGDESEPHHNSALLAGYLENGFFSSFMSVEPVAFRLFPRLQERLREGGTPEELRAAVIRSVEETRPELRIAPAITGVAPVDEQVLLVQSDGTAVPDLLIFGPEIDGVGDDLSRRIGLATTTWRLLMPAPEVRGVRTRLAAFVDPCGDPEVCRDNLATMARQLGDAPPPTDRRGLLVELDGDERQVVASPNHTDAWVRVAVVPGPAEAEAAWRERAWRIVRGIAHRRVQGLALPEGISPSSPSR